MRYLSRISIRSNKTRASRTKGDFIVDQKFRFEFPTVTGIFSKKKTTSRGISNFFKISLWEFLSYWIFLAVFQGLSRKFRLNGSHFGNSTVFRMFRKLFEETSCVCPNIKSSGVFTLKTSVSNIFRPHKPEKFENATNTGHLGKKSNDYRQKAPFSKCFSST